MSLPVYDKEKIKSAFDQYLKTEDPDDFGEFLMALEPLIKTVVKRYHWLERWWEDMTADVMLILWKKHSNINHLKLLRMKLNGNGFDITHAFYAVIHGQMSSIIARFDNIFMGDNRFGAWGFPAEDWISSVSEVEGFGKYDESHAYMAKLMESE